MPTTYRQVMKGFFYHIEANVSFAACMDAEAGWEESLDSPDFCRFLLVSSGQAAITMNGQEYILEPGELFLLPSGTQQACKVYGNGCLRMYWCNFKSFVGEADFFKTMALPVRVRMKEPLHVQELFQKNDNCVAKQLVYEPSQIKKRLSRTGCLLYRKRRNEGGRARQVGGGIQPR